MTPVGTRARHTNYVQRNSSRRWLLAKLRDSQRVFRKRSIDREVVCGPFEHTGRERRGFNTSSISPGSLVVNPGFTSDFSTYRRNFSLHKDKRTRSYREYNLFSRCGSYSPPPWRVMLAIILCYDNWITHPMRIFNRYVSYSKKSDMNHWGLQFKLMKKNTANETFLFTTLRGKKKYCLLYIVYYDSIVLLKCYCNLWF